MYCRQEIRSLNQAFELLKKMRHRSVILCGVWRARTLRLSLIASCLSLTLCLAVSDSCLGQASESGILIKLSNGASIETNMLGINNETVAFTHSSSGHRFSDALSFDEISRIQFPTTAGALQAPSFSVALHDGSRISADQLSISDSTVSMRLANQALLESPQRQVSWIKQKPDAAAGFDDAHWKQVLEDESRTSDAIIVLRNGELEAIEGVIGELQDGKIRFSIGDQTANIKLDKICGIVFYQASRNVEQQAACQVHLLDGSTLFAMDIRLSPTSLTVKTVSGIDADLPPASLSLVDFSMGRAVYLDDLQPATNDWKPLLASDSTVSALRALNLAKAKRSFANKPLTLLVPTDEGLRIAPQPKQFEHGFAMRSGGRLSFNLDDKFTTLSGFVGFDPGANHNGNVLLAVRADGKLLLQEHLENKTMTTPLYLNLDIAGASRIVFLLEYHDGRSVGDQIHLVELKVSK